MCTGNWQYENLLKFNITDFVEVPLPVISIPFPRNNKHHDSGTSFLTHSKIAYSPLHTCPRTWDSILCVFVFINVTLFVSLSPSPFFQVLYIGLNPSTLSHFIYPFPLCGYSNCFQISPTTAMNISVQVSCMNFFRAGFQNFLTHLTLKFYTCTHI